MRDCEVGIGEHLLVPCLRREARVEEKACGSDENRLLCHLVGRIHEEMVDGSVTCTRASGLFL